MNRADFYKFLYDALKGYERKRLITGTYDLNGDHCALGAAFPTRIRHRIFRQFRCCLLGGVSPVVQRTSGAAQFSGIEDFRTVWRSVYTANDAFEGPPEARYEYMLAWLEEQIGLTRVELVPEEVKDDGLERSVR